MDPHALREIAWVFLIKFFRRLPFILGIYSQLTAQHLTMAPKMTILSVWKKVYLGSIHYKIKELVTSFQIYNCETLETSVYLLALATITKGLSEVRKTKLKLSSDQY